VALLDDLQGKPLLRLDSFRWRWPTCSRLAGQVRLAKLSLHRPALAVRRNAAGEVNLRLSPPEGGRRPGRSPGQ
jgi:hypothetical protein